MRKSAFLVALFVALWALAAERYLGTITTTMLADGGVSSTTNASTAAPFTIPTNSKLSVQCDTAAYTVVGDSIDGATATSATGVKVSADQLFLTSTNNTQNLLATLPTAAGTASVCKVFIRIGNEG